MQRNFNPRALPVSIALLAILGTEALAQVAVPYVPPELYRERRWLQGNQITFCVWSVSPTTELDRRVGEEIGNALLADIAFYEFEDRIPLTSDDLWEQVYIQLSERCDAVMGFSLISELAADWLIPTRPYYQAPFVLAVTDPGYERLGDIPPALPVGSVLYSEGDQRFMEYQRLQPQEQRWVRYPFSSAQQGLQFLEDGRVEGTIFWAPAIHELTDGDPAASDIRLIPLDPIATPTTPIGMMLREHNVFLRSELDQAIAALVEDGIIAGILEELNLPETSEN